MDEFSDDASDSGRTAGAEDDAIGMLFQQLTDLQAELALRLYRRATVWAHALLRRTHGGGLDADDLAQEVVRELLETGGRFDPAKGRFRSFFGTVATRCSLRVLAKHRRGQGEPLEDDSDRYAADVTRTARSRLIHAEELAALAAVVERLDADDRHLLQLWMEGRTSTAIGEVLGIRPDAARKRVQRLLARLRAELEGLPPFADLDDDS